jgi:hypothetical protein
VIYIRHGEPTSRATYAAPGLDPNESWRYSRPDGDLVFHFMAREDVQDFKLVESLFDVLGFSNTIALQQGAIGDGVGNPIAEQLILSREHLSPIYQRLQSAGRIASGRYQTEERRVGQESIALGTHTDSYELNFPQELKVRSEVLAVGHDTTGSLVQIAYAIAGSGLEPVTVTRGFLYSVRVRFVAIDSTTGKVVASLDTTRHFVAPAPVPDNEHLVGRVSLPVPVGRYHYRLAIQQGEEAGEVLPTDTVRVGQPFGGALGLSDLVLGSRNTNLYWRRTPQDTIVFNPLRTFRRNDNMELYYEVEGLSTGDPYTVHVTVKKRGGGGGFFKKIFGGGSTEISLKFEEQARPPLAAAHRSLKLDRLKPGNYILEVAIKDQNGRKDRRIQEFQVIDPNKKEKD